MGTIKYIKDQDLVVGVSNQAKGNKKYKDSKQKRVKEKKHSYVDKSSSTDEDSKAKRMKSKRGKHKCGNCRGSHNEKSCFRRKLDIMTKLLEYNNIDVPYFARRQEGKLSLEQENGNFLYDLGARVKHISNVYISDIFFF